MPLPPQVQLNVFYLAYFPGTPLYDRAIADGIITPSSHEASRFWARTRLRYQRNWETFLIVLTRFLRLAVRRKSTPLQTFLRVCGSRPVRIFMRIIPGGFFSALAGAVQGVVLTMARRKERRNLGLNAAKGTRAV